MTRLRVVPAAASTAARPATELLQATPSAPEKLEFKLQSLYEIGNELPPLLAKHSAEVDDPRFPLDIDWNAYFAMTAAGQLAFTTARFGGALVGYIANIVRAHLRFKSTRVCFIEAYWLEPTYREGWNAVRMFRFNDAMLKDRGVQKVYVAVEDRFQDGKADVLFTRLGYEREAVSMIKVFA